MELFSHSRSDSPARGNSSQMVVENMAMPRILLVEPAGWAWFCPFREEPGLVYPDQEEVHRVLPLFLPSGDTGGRGESVMKLNPSPASWEDLSAGGRHTNGDRKSSFKGSPSTAATHYSPPPHLLSHLALNRPLSQEQGPCLGR